MGLKSLRNNYSKLLTAFRETGITLTESQKTDLDTFMLSLEKTIDEVKQSTIKATRKVVEAKQGEEYRKVFESILKHQAEHNAIASMIQNKIQHINEGKEISRKVENYLDTYIESVLPKKDVIDYAKMKRLEQIQESLKDLLLVSEDDVAAKKVQLQESFNKDKAALEAQIASLKTKLDESAKKELSLNKLVEEDKARRLLDEKCKDLPLFEARQIQKRLAKANCATIEKKFKVVLEAIREEMEDEKADDEKSLEDEISGIITAEESEEENSDKAQASDDETKSSEKKDEVKESDGDDDETSDDEKIDEADGENDDDVEIPDSEKIDESFMTAWIQRASRITPLR